jgi:NADH dehydrogenase
MKKMKVVIVGGGFAGIQLIRKLDENLFDILLIDRLNHHQFQPLFYQVATSQIEPSSISFPLRNVFSERKNVQVRMTEVTAVYPDQNKIKTDIGEFDYDFLFWPWVVQLIFMEIKIFAEILSLSKPLTMPLPSEIILLQLLKKIVSASEEEREALNNLVIVGGGPTGVELAGAFAEIKRNILPKDYKGVDFSKFNVILVEGTKNTLGNMTDASKVESKNYLERLGVGYSHRSFCKRL